MRPRSWRWLVVIRDLPPMPSHVEVQRGFLLRRNAEQEARMTRIALNKSIAEQLVSVSVERRGSSS